MLERAVAAGVPFAWFTADEAYGQNPGLRDWLEEQRISYVMAVPVSEPCATSAGKIRADALAARVPAGGWQVLSCGDGSKGPRLYEWALIGLDGPGHQLLVRRALTPNAKGELELAFFLCSAPAGTTLAELAAVAGARWAIEDCFAEAKNETGLDHYQVRRYRAWYRHVTLSMLAHAFLAVTAAPDRAAPDRAAPPPGTGKKGTPGLWTALQPAENI
jgi:SRSO17 transposase